MLNLQYAQHLMCFYVVRFCLLFLLFLINLPFFVLFLLFFTNLLELRLRKKIWGLWRVWENCFWLIWILIFVKLSYAGKNLWQNNLVNNSFASRWVSAIFLSVWLYLFCLFTLLCWAMSWVLCSRGTKRCRLFLLTNSAFVIRVQIRGEGGVAGSQPMSTAVHITWHGAQINFGDL